MIVGSIFMNRLFSLFRNQKYLDDLFKILAIYLKAINYFLHC